MLGKFQHYLKIIPAEIQHWQHFFKLFIFRGWSYAPTTVLYNMHYNSRFCLCERSVHVVQRLRVDQILHAEYHSWTTTIVNILFSLVLITAGCYMTITSN